MKYLEALSLGDGVVAASGSYIPDSFFRKSGAWFKTKFETKVLIKICCDILNLIKFRFYLKCTNDYHMMINILPISLNKIRLVGKALRRRCFSWFLFKRVWWNDDRRALRLRSFDADCCLRLSTSFKSSSPTSDPVNWTIFGFCCSCVFSFLSPLGP